MMSYPNCIKILEGGYIEIKGPLLEQITLNPELFPKISSEIAQSAANDMSGANSNAVTLPSESIISQPTNQPNSSPSTEQSSGFYGAVQGPTGTYDYGNVPQSSARQYMHGTSCSPHIPNLYFYDAQQLARYFWEHGYSEKNILNLRRLYLSNEFVKFAKTIPGYEEAIERIYKDITRHTCGQRLEAWFRGQHAWKLENRIRKLYNEIQIEKKVREFDLQKQRNLQIQKERELQLQKQRELEIQKQKDLELEREFEELHLEAQEELASSSVSSQSSDKKSKPVVQSTRIDEQIPGRKPPRNITLPKDSLNIYDTSLLAQLEDDWLSRKDTAYNSARLEERLDALNKVQMRQGLELDEQLLKELTESRSVMQELDRNFGHDHHVQILSPFVHLRADQAARESNPIVAFELSDFCDTATKVLLHSMHVLYDASYAVDEGIMSGIKHALSIEHWKDMAIGSVQMGLSCAKVMVLDDLEKYCAAIADLIPGSDVMRQLEERDRLHTQAQVKAAFELMCKTHDKLDAMTWQQIIENGTEIGTTMILDTLAFHAIGEFASIASNAFIKELANVTENGQLFTKEYAIEVAGVGKMAIQEGADATATMFESMNEVGDLTKNISKSETIPSNAPKTATVSKQSTIAKQSEVSKIGEMSAEEVMPLTNICEKGAATLEKIRKMKEHGFILKSGGDNIWESPTSLFYKPDKEYGNRINHVLSHSTANLAKKKHTVFNVPEHEILALIDEAWLMKGDPIKSDLGAHIVDMKRIIGLDGESGVK